MSRFLVAALFAAAGLAAVTAQPMDGKVAKKTDIFAKCKNFALFFVKIKLR